MRRARRQYGLRCAARETPIRLRRRHLRDDVRREGSDDRAHEGRRDATLHHEVARHRLADAPQPLDEHVGVPRLLVKPDRNPLREVEVIEERLEEALRGRVGSVLRERHLAHHRSEICRSARGVDLAPRDGVEGPADALGARRELVEQRLARRRRAADGVVAFHADRVRRADPPRREREDVLVRDRLARDARSGPGHVEHLGAERRAGPASRAVGRFDAHLE